jgi:signal transduction histidine kinase
MPVAAAVMAVAVLIGEPDVVSSPPSMTALLVGLVPWTLVAGGIRVAPAVVVGVALVASAVVVLDTRGCGGMFPVMAAVVWAALHTDARLWLAGVVIAALGPIVVASALEGELIDGAVYMVAGVGFSCLTGLLIRRQQQLTAEVSALNALAGEHAATAERARIAREVHDIVAHSLTAVMLHLTGARRTLATDPARADEALARAETVGRDSLDSIRQVVGLLRADDPGHDAVAAPQPGLADREALIESYRAGGLEVDCTVDLHGVDPDPATQLVVYRVIQESLANALQHAPGSACSVRIDAVADALHVVVRNGRPAIAATRRTSGRVGLGLRGMGERVRAAGGTLETGPTPDGGWAVTAVLPSRDRGWCPITTLRREWSTAT